jgi:hypothetical protein
MNRSAHRWPTAWIAAAGLVPLGAVLGAHDSSMTGYRPARWRLDGDHQSVLWA